MKPIDWNKVFDALMIPLIFAVCYTASEIGCIGAILFGIEQPMSLIKAGWTIGLLCGAIVMWFVTARPKNKLLKQYETLTDDLCLLTRHLQHELHKADQKRRIEGDEWKDAD